MARKPQEKKELGPSNGNRLVYEMKVTIRGIRPPVWRRLNVTGDTLLWSLHGILQAVMGWEDENPHRFLIKGTYYGEPDRSPSALEVTDEETVMLGQVISGEKEKFLYEYGTGTGWDHEIVIERILTSENGQRYPICLEGERACPPEHCAGPWRYREFLKTLREPLQRINKDMGRRGGEDFDPDQFSRDDVNRRLGWR